MNSQQLDLAEAVTAARTESKQDSSLPPSLVEYEVENDQWRCNKFGLLVAMLGEPALSEEQMPLFHTLASTSGEMNWLIVRRLYGLIPTIPPSDYPEDDLHSWEHSELLEHLGLSKSQFQQHLDSVRGAWRGVGKRKAGFEGSPAKPARAKPQKKDLFERDPLLKHFDLRVKFRDHDEENWFLSRVRDMEKLFADKMAAGLARNHLLTELQMRRIDELLVDTERCPEGSGAWQRNMQIRKELESTYAKQLDQIRKVAPYAGGIAGKYTVQGCLSDITRVIQLYQTDPNNELVDGMMTLCELEVERRRCVQAPEPQYRLGVTLYVHEMRSKLWQANARSELKFPTLRAYDRACKAALIEESDARGEKMVDLRADGEDGEYGPLPVIPVQPIELNGENHEQKEETPVEA